MVFAVSANLYKEAESLSEYWSPRIVAEVNDQYVKVAKVKGQLVWHSHADEDELFYILKGELKIEYRDHVVELVAGDVHVVPKGVEHNPVAEEECCLALVETKTALHTGDVISEKSKPIEDQLEG